LTTIDAAQYPDSLKRAREAYEQALSIYEYSAGPSSKEVKDTATFYAAFLRRAALSDEAKAVEARYGLASSG
jgi:hypothetical protein